MVTTQNLLDLADNESITIFDIINYFAFGTGTTTPVITNTTLNNEVYRNVIFEGVKDLGNNTFEFTGRLPLTQANGELISNVGLFDSETAGNLGGSCLLPVTFTKNNNDEYLIKIRIKAQTINN